MEVLFKVAATIVVAVFIYGELVFLKWLWPSHIDVRATFSKLIREAAPKTDMIATRDLNKIYQDGVPVGNVIGRVREADDTVVFEKISETRGLKKDTPFEFGRGEHKIIKIGEHSAVDISGLTGSHEAVLKDVVCQKMK